MIFPYSSIISEVDADGDFVLIRRPEIPIKVIGEHGEMRYFALVDTGSDQTILPKSIADDLGIRLLAESGPMANAFGGQRIELFVGEARFELAADGDCCSWKATICFFDFADQSQETIVLGHAGFLEYFTATFDGKLSSLTLVPNGDLPATSPSRRE